jgi:lipopolysaccharide export LptBFGC system permease protein LptF
VLKEGKVSMLEFLDLQLIESGLKLMEKRAAPQPDFFRRLFFPCTRLFLACLAFPCAMVLPGKPKILKISQPRCGKSGKPNLVWAPA